jgi:hypothetical protein
MEGWNVFDGLVRAVVRMRVRLFRRARRGVLCATKIFVSVRISVGIAGIVSRIWQWCRGRFK